MGKICAMTWPQMAPARTLLLPGCQRRWLENQPSSCYPPATEAEFQPAPLGAKNTDWIGMARDRSCEPMGRRHGTTMAGIGNAATNFRERAMTRLLSSAVLVLLSTVCLTAGTDRVFAQRPGAEAPSQQGASDCQKELAVVVPAWHDVGKLQELASRLTCADVQSLLASRINELGGAASRGGSELTAAPTGCDKEKAEFYAIDGDLKKVEE